MIKIDDEYLLNANENCYTLERISTIEDTSSPNYGKETKTIQGYYTTIESALNGYIKCQIRKFISKDTKNTFAELIKVIKNLKIYIQNLMEESINGFEK